jgi:hypothetical protein
MPASLIRIQSLHGQEAMITSLASTMKSSPGSERWFSKAARMFRSSFIAFSHIAVQGMLFAPKRTFVGTNGISAKIGSTGNGRNPMFNGRWQPSRGGPTRMMREYQVRFCERHPEKFVRWKSMKTLRIGHQRLREPSRKGAMCMDGRGI